ncbi:MAG: hypothetical protein H7123_00450 [Thermoleophilia bacterium]|nr:hypothetical protein [Thermoleophilia bacterium]
MAGGNEPSYVWFAGAPKWFWATNTGAAIALPADTVAYGAAWATPVGWSDGLKTQGMPSFQPTFENRDLETDQDDEAIHAWRTANGFSFKIPMLDATLASLNRALGQGTITAGANGSTLAVGGDTPIVSWFSIGMEGYKPGGISAATPKARRLWVPKCTPTAVSELGYDRKQEKVVEVTFKAYIDTDQAVGKRLWSLGDLT